MSRSKAMLIGLPLSLLVLMLALAVAVRPAVGQDAEAETEVQEWDIGDYEDPYPYLQSIWVSPDGRFVFFDQLRDITGHEADQSWYSRKWCTFVLDTEEDVVDDAGNALAKKLTAHYDVWYVLYSPDQKYVLVGLGRRTYPVRATFLIKDAESGKTVGKISSPEWAMARWIGSKRIAVSQQIEKKYGFVRIYSPKGKKLAQTKFRGVVTGSDAEGKILAMRANRSDMSLPTDYKNCDIAFVSAENGQILASAPRRERQRVVTGLVSPNGQYAVAGRICWSYGDSLTEHEITVFDLSEEARDEDKTRLLKLYRKSPIFPCSITDDGNVVVVAQSPMGGQRYGAVKLMNTEGKSRTLVPYNACGARLHDGRVYCIVDGAMPKIIAAPAVMEGDMTDDETTRR